MVTQNMYYSKKNVNISLLLIHYVVPSKDKSKSASYCVIKFNKWETKK